MKDETKCDVQNEEMQRWEDESQRNRGDERAKKKHRVAMQHKVNIESERERSHRREI